MKRAKNLLVPVLIFTGLSLLLFCRFAIVCTSCSEQEVVCFEEREEALENWKKDESKGHIITKPENVGTRGFDYWCYQRTKLYGCCYSICFPFYRFPA